MVDKGLASSFSSSSSSSSLTTSPVCCCMCGDEGFPKELFRCKACHVRFQHKYCSNLYPRAENYRACNWCLTSSSLNANSERERSLLSSSAQVVIKKQRVVVTQKTSPAAKQSFKRKVIIRYKLLEEVLCKV